MKSLSEIRKHNKDSTEYIIIAGGDKLDIVQDLIQEKIKIFTSDFVLNSIMHCSMDFEKDTL